MNCCDDVRSAVDKQHLYVLSYTFFVTAKVAPGVRYITSTAIAFESYEIWKPYLNGIFFLPVGREFIILLRISCFRIVFWRQKANYNFFIISENDKTVEDRYRES